MTDPKISIIIDFSEISIITSSYADEVFGKAIKELGISTFLSRVQFVNIDNIVKSIIDKAICQRLSTPD